MNFRLSVQAALNRASGTVLQLGRDLSAFEKFISVFFFLTLAVKMADDENWALSLARLIAKKEYKTFLLVLLFTLGAIINVSCKDTCNGLVCEHGICTENNTKCECFEGWSGASCTHCQGRIK